MTELEFAKASLLREFSRRGWAELWSSLRAWIPPRAHLALVQEDRGWSERAVSQWLAVLGVAPFHARYPALRGDACPCGAEVKLDSGFTHEDRAVARCPSCENDYLVVAGECRTSG